MARDADGEDLISSLPDDSLREILLRLLTASAAAQTSLLSRRWRYLWAHLLDLRFPLPTNLAHVRSALAAYAAPGLRCLDINTHDATPEATTAVLRLAAPLLTGELLFQNLSTLYQEDLVGSELDLESDVVELPCFHTVTEIYITLDFLRLTLPPSGVFSQLVVLYLHHIWFDGWCDLGDIVSSARCPLLRDLGIENSEGLTNLSIHSKSLIRIELHDLEGLEQLTVVAPVLVILDLFCCFVRRKPVSNISTPELRMPRWIDVYDPSSVIFGEMAHLRNLGTLGIWVFGPPGYPHNWNSVFLLQHFKAVTVLELYLSFPIVMINCQYLLGAITMLPDTDILSLELSTRGHAMGPCVFHLLRLSTGIRKLMLKYRGDIEEPTTCSSGCICDQLKDWETENILLNSLTELVFSGLQGAEHEFAFLKQLFRCTVLLKTITITFDPSIPFCEDVCAKLHSLSRLGTCMKITFHGVMADGAMSAPV